VLLRCGCIHNTHSEQAFADHDAVHRVVMRVKSPALRLQAFRVSRRRAGPAKTATLVLVEVIPHSDLAHEDLPARQMIDMQMLVVVDGKERSRVRKPCSSIVWTEPLPTGCRSAQAWVLNEDLSTMCMHSSTTQVPRRRCLADWHWRMRAAAAGST